MGPVNWSETAFYNSYKSCLSCRTMPPDFQNNKFCTLKPTVLPSKTYCFSR